jgi:hypothetical protein
MKKRHYILFAILLLLIAAPMAWLLRNFARDILAVEFLRVIWVVGLLIRSIPQLPIWAIFIISAFIIASGSLLKGDRPGWSPPEIPVEREGRVRTTWGWISRANEGMYSRWRLAQQLSDLTLETIAYRHQMDIPEIRRRFQAGQLGVPQTIRGYVRAGMGPMLWRTDSPFAHFLSRFFPRFRRENQLSPLSLNPELVVEFLEDQLEI